MVVVGDDDDEFFFFLFVFALFLVDTRGNLDSIPLAFSVLF